MERVSNLVFYFIIFFLVLVCMLEKYFTSVARDFVSACES